MDEKKSCIYCDAEFSVKRRSAYCQRCYLYAKGPHHGRIYEVEPNKQTYAPNGDPVCALCGRAYAKLGNHLWQAHQIDPITYLTNLNLPHNTRLTSVDFQEKMREYVRDNYDRVVEENLLQNGRNTRFVPGDPRVSKVTKDD